LLHSSLYGFLPPPGGDVTSQFVVDSELIADYRRDGAVCLRNCFSDKWVSVLNQGVDRNIANPGKYFADFTAVVDTSRAIKDDFSWERIPEYQHFFYSSPAAEIAAQLMGANEVCFLEDQYFQKEAQSSTRTPWHQDQPYYNTRGRWCVMWIPLDPVIESDSLNFVAGSHLWGRLFRPTSFSASNDDAYGGDDPPAGLEKMIDIDADLEKYTILSWELQPGDCIVFHPCAIHGNNGNQSAGRARRLSMRWAAEDLIYDAAAYPWVGLRDDHGLSTGDRVRGPKFPLVWTAAAGLIRTCDHIITFEKS
jgi:ectoine hydroxylase-related dioxygenase (phytanoyl-CoA dioxygenase family)